MTTIVPKKTLDEDTGKKSDANSKKACDGELGLTKEENEVYTNIILPMAKFTAGMQGNPWVHLTFEQVQQAADEGLPDRFHITSMRDPLYKLVSSILDGAI